MSEGHRRYAWFRRLGFDFDNTYPEAGGLDELDRLIMEMMLKRGGEARAEGTSFRESEVTIQRRLFALAKDDPEARAELAMLIAYTHGKNLVAATE